MSKPNHAHLPESEPIIIKVIIINGYGLLKRVLGDEQGKL
jgi:hypothetical protein